MKSNPVIAILFFLSVITVASCTKNTEDAKVTPPVTVLVNDNDNLLLGNPTNAVTETDNPENYLMRNPYYALSYNKFKGTPNWVSWHLFQSDLGSVSRQEIFMPDSTLPNSWYHVQSYSYSGSGFDRGHNCPSADRTITEEANYFTFFLTNIIPQAPKNNQITWAGMESYIRNQVFSGMEAYIIMGSYGLGGVGTNGPKDFIDCAGDGCHVTVPSKIWKVVVLIPNGDNDTSRISASTRVIAVDIPNRNDVNSDWKAYRTSVDAIEDSAKVNLLTRLPEALQATLESKVDDQ